MQIPHLTAPATAFLMAAAALPAPLVAQTSDAAAVFDALRLGEIVEVMRSEGLSYADEIAEAMIPGAPSPDWGKTVDRIYDAERMRAVVLADFENSLDPGLTGEILDFFRSEPGPTIVSLEVEARAAMLDDAVEAASNEVAAEAMTDETDRYRLLSRFVEANDLIETNVVGALNSNFAFYEALAAAGAMPAEMTQDQLLALVWSQEEDIRASTTEWVFSYLLLAYQPLADADVEAYIAFSETPAGRALNRALFEGFDELFVDISRSLGTATALEMSGQAL